MMELEERHHQELLDATLPWFPCSHCGNKTRQDKIKEVDGKKFCGDCASKIRECQYCHRNYVMKSMVIKYKKDGASKVTVMPIFTALSAMPETSSP